MYNIGIPVSNGKTQFVINQAYVNYVADAGYNPVLITPRSSVEQLMKFCDGLLLPGGIDIDPVFYNEDNVYSHGVDPNKDDFERRCMYSFIKESKPIFGICRGFQIIIREFMRHGMEGSDMLGYWQHLNKHRNTAELDIMRTIRSHSVDMRADVLYGVESKFPKRDFVNSIHHQAVIIRVPKKEDFLQPVGMLVPLAATKIGVPSKTKGYVLEAFGIRGWNHTPIRAVQWHPEELADTALLSNFFDRNVGKKSRYIKKTVIPEVKKDGGKKDNKVENSGKQD